MAGVELAPCQGLTLGSLCCGSHAFTCPIRLHAAYHTWSLAATLFGRVAIILSTALCKQWTVTRCTEINLVTITVKFIKTKWKVIIITI
jgi:hypothetical protein